MKTGFSFALALLLAFPLCGTALAEDKPGASLPGVIESHEMIPMRDGVKLSVYLFLPKDDKGPWPVVFEQRYASLTGEGTRKAAAELARAGYAVALVNFRGTHLSEGTWVGYRALQWGELRDGYDVCEWLATRPWCTGKVGTMGGSQGGFAQNYLAVTQPPHLVCQYMTDTGLSLFHEGYRMGGVTRPQRFLGLGADCARPEDNVALLKEWLQHPHYDDYWRAEDCTLHFKEMNVPCFTVGSWFDFMNQGSIASFQGRQSEGGPMSRGHQQLIIGPWLHGGAKSNRIAEMVYPENAAWDMATHKIRWFDHYLKGVDNGIEKESPVRYYVMGATGEAGAPGNVWRTATTFPPPEAVATSLYLQPGGGLDGHLPSRGPTSTSLHCDPRQPMTIEGRSFPGAKDARGFEAQKDVLTFTSAPLTAPVEWTGRASVELQISSTARDTDFIVRISDVYPDGRSILLVSYPWRARYREGFDHEALLTPGEIHSLAFPVGWMSQIFNVGHRIRVTIANTGAPLYEPNPQTGEPATMDFPENAVAATHQIHHSAEHASRLIVPVMK
ncbi:MAG TPA: CocE/NonD family hydrolase [Verrucomicrobiales bacterium]|nr:CocE/NonD family hydrolase [Verrucomicrobiales bacterium]